MVGKVVCEYVCGARKTICWLKVPMRGRREGGGAGADGSGFSGMSGRGLTVGSREGVFFLR